jgi:hypothetical protein
MAGGFAAGGLVPLRRLLQFDLSDVDDVRVGDRQAVLCQAVEVENDGLLDEPFGFIVRGARGPDSGERGHEGAPAGRRALVHHRPGAQRASFGRPAWRKMLPSVPGASSWLGLPATVTRPVLVGWRNWRWLPRWTTWHHPSFSNVRTTSRTFTGRDRRWGMCHHCRPSPEVVDGPSPRSHGHDRAVDEHHLVRMLSPKAHIRGDQISLFEPSRFLRAGFCCLSYATTHLACVPDGDSHTPHPSYQQPSA